METTILDKNELQLQNIEKQTENIVCPNFVVGSIAWHTVSAKMINRTIETILLDTLKLKNYTATITCYAFVIHVASHYESAGHKYFSKKEHILYNTAQLDYHQFEKATESEALTMQAEAYLAGILQIPTLRGMKKVAFDNQQFYQDCKTLFENVGWIAKK